MAIEGLGRIVGAHVMFAWLGKDFLDLVAGCAKNVRFAAGEYLYREGHVALELGAPGLGRMTFLTAGPNSVVGLSWLVPPYRWTCDARAQDDVRASSIEAICLRDKCDADPALG